MKKFLALMLAVAMVLTLVACGSSPDLTKKQEAVDSFNAMSASYDELVELLNEYIDLLPEGTVEEYNSIVDEITPYKEHLESEDVLSDEEYDAMIALFDTIKTQVEDGLPVIQAEIDAITSQPDAGSGEVDPLAILTGCTWEVVGGTLGEDPWDDATLASVMETFGGSCYYNFDMDGNVTQILGTGSEVTGTYSAYDDVYILLDFSGTQMLAAVAETEVGYALYISDMEMASTMILVASEG